MALAPYEKILASAARAAFLTLLSAQLKWTIAKLAPSWAKPGHRDRNEERLYEWNHELGGVLGRVAGHCTPDEVRSQVLDPILSLERDYRWALLQPMVDLFIRAHILDAPEVPPHAIPVLETCLDALLQAREFEPSSYRAGELHGFDMPLLVDALMFVAVEQAAKAARYVNGDWSEINLIMPIIDRFVRAAGWASYVMDRYLTLCERSKDAFPAEAFADEVLEVIGIQSDHLQGWHGSMLPARIAGLVQHFADRETPLQALLGQKLLRILDLLVDMGDRRSAALQLSEAFREVQTGSPVA